MTGNGKRVAGAADGVRIGPMALKRLPDGRLEGSSEGDSYALLPKKSWSPGAKDVPPWPGAMPAARRMRCL